MTTLNYWDDGPSPVGDPTILAHKLGLHDVPEDDCPACRVDRGAVLLDERRPGWWEDVDVERLDIGTCEDCVLGLTFGSFGSGVLELFAGTIAADTVSHGFTWLAYAEIDTLTELWRSKINERRAR